MTADELHDSLWMFYGDVLENIGVEALRVEEREGKLCVVSTAGKGLPAIEMLVPREDPHFSFLLALAKAARRHWWYRCESCHRWFVRGPEDEAEAVHREEFGREVSRSDVMVCDDCYEVVMAGPVAALRSMGEEA